MNNFKEVKFYIPMKKWIAFCFMLYGMGSTVSGQTIFDVLYQKENPTCILITDLKVLIQKKEMEEYQPGTFIVKDANSVDTFKVEVRTRGNARKANCYYPPFKIKFKKAKLITKEPNTVKIANCCKNTNYHEQVLTKEYLAYKIYETITDLSFRSMLIDIEYQDVNGKYKPHVRPAIMLENEDQLASKLGGKEYGPSTMPAYKMDSTQLATMTLFEYLIGNSDWAVGNLHNCVVVATRDNFIPVPYDFDYAGIVNANYAVPHESLPIKSVAERYNRGTCLTEDQCERARQLILSKKDEILAIATSSPRLVPKEVKGFTKYLERSLEVFENEKYTKNIFTKQCREVRRPN